MGEWTREAFGVPEAAILTYLLASALGNMLTLVGLLVSRK